MPVLATYGHFTAMQVRGGRVRGLAHHLTRLDAANRELFGPGLDGDGVRERVRRALHEAGAADASVRVYVYVTRDDRDPSVLVTVRPPASARDTALGLKAVAYQRPVPHIKGIADFGQTYHIRAAERAGFDDALLTASDGVVSEAGIANVCFFDGAGIVWPDAPALAGITMQVLEPALAGAGLPSRRARIRVADLAGFAAAFVTNSHGIAPVGRVDDLSLPVDAALLATLRRAYESVPPDAI